MPIYEYSCGHCRHEFETLVRGASDVPRCPQCDGTSLTKQFSVPAAAHANGASRSSLPICNPEAVSPGGCGAPACGMGMCGLGD